MSSELNPEMTSRNLVRVSGFGYRESIARGAVGATGQGVPTALVELRTSLAAAGIMLSRLLDQPKIRSSLPQRATVTTQLATSPFGNRPECPPLQ